MDFAKLLKEKLQKIDEEVFGAPEPRKVEPVKVQGPLYDIYKLSLPLGYIQKRVIMNLTEEEADMWVKDIKNTRMERLPGGDTNILVFFEKFKQGDPVDILKNPRPSMIKEKKYEDVEIIKGSSYQEHERSQEQRDIYWQG